MEKQTDPATRNGVLGPALSTNTTHMSVSIRSCPGCDSLILADTFQCPDCGHVFDEEKASKLAGVGDMASAEMEEPCPKCGESVRSGLVRCPGCSHFMRDDIAKKYDDMQSSPQKIIYSNAEREDYLPPRINGDVKPDLIMDAVDQDAGPADDDGFELGNPDGASPAPASPDSGPSDGTDEGGFQLGEGTSNMPGAPVHGAAAANAAPVDAATADALSVDNPKDASKDEQKAVPQTETADSAAAGPDSAKANTDGGSDSAPTKATPDLDADGLLAIAQQDERDITRRRSQRRRKEKENRVLIPCSCGAWMRVRDHQMGKTVRCRKCGRNLPVPQLLKKKSGEDEKKKEDVNLPWIKDLDYVTVDPGNLRLKVGSVSANAAPVDVIVSRDGIAICMLTAKAKAGLFASKGKSDPADEKRAGIMSFLQGGGSISSVPSEKTIFVPADKISELQIAQPVKHAHESMFAGVAVFGDGRIAIRVPASDKGTDQHFISMGLTDFRFFAAQLSRLFDVSDYGNDQGIPTADKKTAFKCHYTGTILNALSESEYHEADRHIEMILLGRKCGACGIAVGEESRKKQKIGGASGRGLSRAKCPKCNGKFGNHSLYFYEVKDTAPRLEVEEPDDSDDAGTSESGKIAE